MRWLALLTLVSTPALAEPVDVVATFPILADIASEVGGDRVTVTSLVPVGGDAHVYEPTPRDVARVADADLVVVNGLGFEGWMDRLLDAAGAAEVVVASSGVTPIEAGEHAHASYDHTGHDHTGHDHTGHDHGAHDPHAWQDVGNARAYVAAIAEALTKADPDGASTYAANAARYDGELAVLDAEIVAAMTPYRGRRVLTTHKALTYLGRRYELEFVGVQGLSTEAEPSARDVAELIREVKAERIDAVFVEAVSDRRMVEQIAAETDAAVGAPLYVDTLSPADGPAPTYVAMMRYNATALTDALSQAQR